MPWSVFCLDFFQNFQHQQALEELPEDSEDALDSSLIPTPRSKLLDKIQLPRKSYPSAPKSSNLSSSSISLPPPFSLTTFPSSSHARSTPASPRQRSIQSPSALSTLTTTLLPTAVALRNPSTTEVVSSNTHSSTTTADILLPWIKKTFPSDLLVPSSRKNANQFFLLFNGPFYVTFKEPLVSNSLPPFLDLPAFTETEENQTRLPLIIIPDSATGDDSKVLPEPSMFSNASKFGQTDQPNDDMNSQSMNGSEPSFVVKSSTEESNNEPEVSGVKAQILESVDASMFEKLLPIANSTETVVMQNSSDLWNLTELANKTEVAALIQEVSKKKTFEEHLEEFLRYLTHGG